METLSRNFVNEVPETIYKHLFPPHVPRPSPVELLSRHDLYDGHYFVAKHGDWTPGGQCRRLDLKTIALHARNAEYNPKRFAAAIMRIREPKSTALIFASGKMIVTGVKCEPDARLAARKYARVLQKLGYNARFCNFSIHNVVASVDVGFPIHISQMQAVHHAFSSYEPGRWHGHPRNRSRTCHANCIQSSSLA